MANEYRINQINAEVVAQFDSAARLHHISAEVVHKGPDPQAQLHCIAIEVVRSIDDVSSGRRRQTIINCS